MPGLKGLEKYRIEQKIKHAKENIGHIERRVADLKELATMDEQHLLARMAELEPVCKEYGHLAALDARRLRLRRIGGYHTDTTTPIAELANDDIKIELESIQKYKDEIAEFEQKISGDGASGGENDGK